MTRPSIPIELVKGHRTKAEIETRKEAEKALLTGTPLKEWDNTKNNKIAHKEFLRIKKLLQAINKDDGLHESVINRYCLIIAECNDFEEKREKFYKNISELEVDKDKLIESEEISLSTYYKMKYNMQKTIIDLDKQVQAKRKMLLDIEKENIMTIASALRSIPKKPDKEDKPSGVAAFMSKRG
jgi:hypothetical protein